MKAARARSLALEDLPDDLIARVIELGGRKAWRVPRAGARSRRQPAAAGGSPCKAQLGPLWG